MVPASIWLLFSHAMLIGIGSALLENGGVLWGLLFLLVLPGLRVWRRFGSAGYQIIGYIGATYGDKPRPGGRITRDSDPVRFRIMLAVELASILFMWGSVLVRLYSP